MTPFDETEGLTRFVPQFLQRRIAESPAPFDTSFAERLNAAVLFADISGFTALSEKLASQGAQGVEELTQVLNAYFGRLIDIIDDHGGDVIKFAGDALLAYWPEAHEGELWLATEQAALCGLRVQDSLKSFGNTINHRLQMRVGVGSGPVMLVSLGGVYKRWECVMYGAGVTEATISAAKSEPGFVTLGQQAWEMIWDHAAGEVIEAGFHRLDSLETRNMPAELAPVEITPAMKPSLLGYIPAAIHRRLAARQSAWLSELRRITVLFVNLPDLNVNTPPEKSSAAIRDLQTELYRFEGSVNKLSIDEKGITLVAAYGLPPFAHEDDPQRGAFAAMRVSTRLAELGWNCSVGVTSGRVFCGTIGNRHRCEYTIIGDVVNLSARLMQAAKGGIYCDEATFKRVPTRVVWETLPPIMVKGKAQPVPVYRPLRHEEESQVPYAARSMVGRAAEREILVSLLGQLKRVQVSAVALIIGDAGIGKSTLVADLLERSRELEIATLVGVAFPLERSTPFYIWRAVFRHLFELDANAGKEEQRRKTLARLADEPDLIELAPLLDVALSLDFPATPTTAEMFGEVRLFNTNELLIRLLKRRTRVTPLQIILEDGHWMDSASWSLARQAAAQVPALMLVIVTRPMIDPFPRDYPPLLAAPNTHKVVLEALSAEESLALVMKRLGATEIPPALAEFLRGKALGNPFFIEEITYDLRDSGKIRIRDGRAEIAPGVDLDSLPFPDHVQGFVTSRIDRLAPAEQMTLKVASVVGRTFASRLVRDICPIENDRPFLEVHLQTLVSQNLTVSETPEPEPCFSFRHVITQEVAYQMMPPTQQKSLHRSVAEWYESRYQSDLTPYYPLLARHWSTTDETAKSIDYFEKSGECAMRDFIHDEAILFFEQALTLSERSGANIDPFRKARWRRQLAEAYYNQGDQVTSRRQFFIALGLMGYPGRMATWKMALLLAWELTKQTAHRLLPGWFVGRVSGEKAARRLEASRAYERLVQIYYLNNEKLPAIFSTFRSLNLSETVGVSVELARHYSHGAVFCGLLMMHGTALAHTRRAREIARAVNQQECTAYVEFICAVYLVTVGDWAQCESSLNQAILIADRLGLMRRGDESRFTLANTLSRKGDYRGSEALSEQIHRSAAVREATEALVWGLTWRMECLMAIDPDGPTLNSLEKELIRTLAEHPTVPLGDQILGHAMLAKSCWRRGEIDGARESLAAATAIIDRTDQVSHYLLPAYASLIEVVLGFQERDAADAGLVADHRRRAARLLKILGQFAIMYPIGRPAKWLMSARQDWLAGNRHRAYKHWRKALAAAEKFGMPYEQAEAHADLALHLPSTDLTRPGHLERAREIFAQIGSKHDLRKIDRLTNGLVRVIAAPAR